MRSRSRLWARLVASATCAALLGACATNPVTGRREITLVSPAQELEIGQQGYAPVLAAYGLYDDAALQTYVNAVGQKVARASHLPDLDWHFTIVDDAAVNAFAMPGGYIYITRGLLVYLNSEAQLAGVLGHEIGHVTRRHSAARITQQQLYGAGLALGSVVSKTVERYSGAAQQAMDLMFLQFSRTDETQADELGVDYATKAGFDPREIPATYAMLQRISAQSGQRLPGFLETHPDPGDRARVTTELARRAASGKSELVIHAAQYVQRMDGVLFGQDPRQGYFIGDVYYHPTMRFQMTFPAGWAHQESHSTVAAAEPGQSAIMQLSAARAAASISPEAFAAKLVSDGAVSAVRGGPETIHGHGSWVGQLDIAPAGQTASTLDAAFIRKDAVLFQAVGQSKKAGDVFEQRIFSAMRSFATLADPARIAVTPNRVRVRAAAAAGSFETVIRRLGAEPSFLASDAIMNNVDLAGPVVSGALMKFVVRSN